MKELWLICYGYSFKIGYRQSLKLLCEGWFIKCINLQYCSHYFSITYSNISSANNDQVVYIIESQCGLSHNLIIIKFRLEPIMLNYYSFLKILPIILPNHHLLILYYSTGSVNLMSKVHIKLRIGKLNC